jgi:hypothetical protein
MRFAVESWSPGYGTPIDDEALAEGTSQVDASAEVPIGAWAPRRPAPGTEPLTDVLFVDGVRRVEAHVWITADDGEIDQAICASYAAGAVRCIAGPTGAAARLLDARVERGLFCPRPVVTPIRTWHATFGVHVPDDEARGDLSLLLQRRMGELEARVARGSERAELVLVDGPLRTDLSPVASPDGVGAVGYVKTHRAAYGPPAVRDVVTRLAVGERTPLLRLGEVLPRFTWYQWLPCSHRHGWAGIVRLEAAAAGGLDAAIAVADRLALSLGRFASAEAKDPRAPQNLYPVGGLERELRRRLGDPALLLRALRQAAAA